MGEFDTNNTNGFRYQVGKSQKALMKFKTTKKAKEKLILQILSKPVKHFFTSILFFWRALLRNYFFSICCFVFKYKNV